MPKAYNRTGESLLDVICNYLLITLLLVLLGLLVPGESGRGLPVPWLFGSQVDGSRLLLSFIMFAAVVVIAGIFARIHRAGETDYTSQYKSANVIANKASNVLVNDTDEYSLNETLEYNNVSSNYKSENKSEKKSSSRDVKPTLKKRNHSSASMPTPTITAGRNKKNSSTLVVAIVVVLIATFMLSMVGALFDDFSDDWDNIDISDSDDEYVTDTSDFDEMQWAIRFATYDFSDEDWLSKFDDTEAFTEFINNNDLSIGGYDMEFLSESILDDGDKSSAVVRCIIENSEGERYYSAFYLVCKEDYDGYDIQEAGESDIDIAGVSIAPGMLDLLNDDYDIESYDYSDEEWNKILEEANNNSISIGTTSVNDMPILIYAE